MQIARIEYWSVRITRLPHDVNVITSSLCLTSSRWENKDQLRGGGAVIRGSSSKLPACLTGHSSFYIVLIRPDRLGSMTNTSHEGFFKRMQLHSQIPLMQHQQWRSD